MNSVLIEEEMKTIPKGVKFFLFNFGFWIGLHLTKIIFELLFRINKNFRDNSITFTQMFWKHLIPLIAIILFIIFSKKFLINFTQAIYNFQDRFTESFPLRKNKHLSIIKKLISPKVMFGFIGALIMFGFTLAPLIIFRIFFIDYASIPMGYFMEVYNQLIDLITWGFYFVHLSIYAICLNELNSMHEEIDLDKQWIYPLPNDKTGGFRDFGKYISNFFILIIGLISLNFINMILYETFSVLTSLHVFSFLGILFEIFPTVMSIVFGGYILLVITLFLGLFIGPQLSIRKFLKNYKKNKLEQLLAKKNRILSKESPNKILEIKKKNFNSLYKTNTFINEISSIDIWITNVKDLMKILISPIISVILLIIRLLVQR